MSIEYTYNVVAVDQAAHCMEIVYTSAGRQTMHIGTRLPYVGETLEAIVQMYAPIAYWIEQDEHTIAVAVGSSGTMNKPVPITLDLAKANKMAELADDRWKAEVSGVQIYGATITTDRGSQSALNNANLALQSGAVQSVSWKAANETWLDLDATEMAAVVQAVTAHVENCFTTEKQLVSLVKAATTIEAVEAIKWPQ